MASGFAAGAGADMLQQVLRRKLEEQQVRAQQQQFAAKLAEDVRQANLQNEIQKGNLSLGGRRVDEDARQFNEQAPLRIANIGHLDASTGELRRKPQAEQDERAFATGRDASQQAFTTKRDAAQHGYQMQEIGAQGANARSVAGINHPDPAAAAASTQQQNEVADTIALIDQISKDSSLRNAVGPVDQYAGGVINADPSGVNRFKALHDQLTGKMSLAQAGKLKGQGQISDKERAMLAAAATALSRGLNEKDYAAELGKVRAQFVRMQQVPGGANISAAQEFDYVPGKGLVPRKR